ncbi:biopolymer transporter ExbD [Isosphaeraceae bacterium EP7]
MPTWDVFVADRLEVIRNLDLDALRAALARGECRDDDLVRLSGTTNPWTSLADLPGLAAPAPARPTPAPPIPPAASPTPAPVVEAPPAPVPKLDGTDADLPQLGPDEGDYEEVVDDLDDGPSSFDVIDPGMPEIRPTTGGYGGNDQRLVDDASADLIPVYGPDELSLDDPYDGEDEEDEDEGAGEFSLARPGADKIEELDLAAMVDVAFQLVLFFLVTATTVLSKTLEIPKPNPENAPGAVAQGRSKNLDDLSKDYIVVEIDPAGAVKIDHEPVNATAGALTEALRRSREATGRRSMLLTADFATPHRSAVLAYDAANEIGLSIAIARPTPPSPLGNGGGAAPAPAGKAAGGR